jgi:hypothetical protein
MRGMKEARRPEQTRAAFVDALQDAHRSSTLLEPQLGIPGIDEVERLRRALGALASVTEAGLAQLDVSSRAKSAEVIARVYARSAAIAVAARDRITADCWLEEAARLACCEELLREVAAARAEPERYRQLAHGRHLLARGDERGARQVWQALATGCGKRPEPRRLEERGRQARREGEVVDELHEPTLQMRRVARPPGGGGRDLLARLATAELSPVRELATERWPAWKVVRAARLGLLVVAAVMILGFALRSCVHGGLSQTQAQRAVEPVMEDGDGASTVLR